MSLLVAYDASWPAMAQAEAARWRENVMGLVTVHHIGSTAIPGMPAKSVIDLLPVFADAAAADAAQSAVETMGYEWMGPFGLEGRRYCRNFDPDTGQRRVHAHAYVQGHAGILRHLAFRDALLGNAPLRVAYASVKAACAGRHPDGGVGYQDCKSAWIAKTEARALETLK
ncbi:MAG: GrpB family protein [Tateyamaria sp.]|uniref:GrpB family protein n=1 Tax=Tateyamaria sp. TaxID=1929288 RepID=UPI00327D5AE2